MVRVALIAIVGVTVWYCWRLIQRQQAQVGERLRQAEASLKQRDTVHLERDPETGVYRPPDRPD